MAPDIFSSQPALRIRHSRFAAAYRVLEQAIAERVFPGCAFGVLAGDEIVLQDGLGRFTYEDEAPAVLPQTVYDVASLTKVVATTAAVMLLVQRNQLNLDEPLEALLPAFAAGRALDDPALRITLRHLLAHSSGLPGYVEFFRTCFTPEALLKACMELKVQAAPGTRAEYSDPGFILLGKALEAMIGEPLDVWVRREVIGPLGLTATGFCPPESTRPAIPPTEVEETLRHRRIQGEVQDENAFVLGGVSGHAGLFSNVPDLLRFAGEILDAGVGSEADGERARLFEPGTVESFAQRQGPAASSRALGWDTPSGKPSTAGSHFSPHSIGHLGFSGCSLWIDLEARAAIALLTNRTWPKRPAGPSQLFREVRAGFHDAVREAL